MPALTIFLVIALPVMALWSTPAGAHSDEGQMTVVAVGQSGPSTVDVEVGIVFANDGHLAEEATVTASFTGNVEIAIDPVVLPQISGGRYGTQVELPAGSWTIAIESSNPTASATASVEVGPIDATTTTSDVPTTTGPTTQETSSEGSSWTGTLITVAIALALGAALGTLLAFRNRPRR